MSDPIPDVKGELIEVVTLERGTDWVDHVMAKKREEEYKEAHKPGMILFHPKVEELLSNEKKILVLENLIENEGQFQNGALNNLFEGESGRMAHEVYERIHGFSWVKSVGIDIVDYVPPTRIQSIRWFFQDWKERIYNVWLALNGQPFEDFNDDE